MKKNLTLLTVITALILSFFGYSFADAAAGAPSSNRILIIYSTNGAYNTELKNDFISALSSIVPAPIINTLTVSALSGAGFYDELVAAYGETTLADWCQVWDLRFTEAYQNPGAPCPGGSLSEEQISLGAGATTDQSLYRNFLLQGGGLFIQAEHQERPCRNTNVIAFANIVANTPIGVGYGGVIINAGGSLAVTMSNYDNFNSDFNAIAGPMNLLWTGGIPTWALGSAKSLITADGLGASVLMGYIPADLNTASGRMIISWESTSYMTSYGRSTLSDNVLKNSYDFLSNSSCVYETPTPSNTPTFTNTFTHTPTFTPTNTFTNTNTFTQTPTFTNTHTPTITPTPTPEFVFEHKTNYPNPFKKETWILYRVTRDAKVTVKIFTVSGEKIAELKQDAVVGYNRMYWNGTNDYNNNASSGVYVYSIMAESGADKSEKYWGKMSIIR
jgi:hypothetical protein